MEFEDISVNVGTTSNNVSSSNDEANQDKKSWHTPTITRIDIRRTLNGSGSVTDGSFAFTPI